MMSMFESAEGFARDMAEFHTRAYHAALASGFVASAAFHQREAQRFRARLVSK